MAISSRFPQPEGPAFDPPVSTDFVPAQDMIQVKVWKSDIEESESEDEEETKNQAEIKDSEEEEEQEKGKQEKEEEVPRLDGIETRIWSSN